VSVVEHITIAGLFMAGLGVALAALLVVANRLLHVDEDPRIDEVEEMLPHSNCGACGIAGCRPFAEAVVEGQVPPAQCTVNSREMTEAIAEYLGVDIGDQERRIARIACAGGSHVAATRARYEGLKSCRAAALVSGGGKGCVWGCLGLADCEVSCNFDAIRMNKFSLPVVDSERCTACGDCVEACPKDLFSLQPVSRRLWVACRNLDDMDEVEAHCDVACTACARCASDSPAGLIDIRDNLAIVNYEMNGMASPLAIERCPTGAIVWFNQNGQPIKGADARKVVRKEPLRRIEPLPRS
jgi:electron transport complex protein RnfB